MSCDVERLGLPGAWQGQGEMRNRGLLCLSKVSIPSQATNYSDTGDQCSSCNTSDSHG